MNLIHWIRSSERRLASAGGVVFLLCWLGLAAAPCALAMVAPDTGHDCPHCPPPPCHEMQAGDCTYPDSLDLPRAGEEFTPVFALPPAPVDWTISATPVHPQPFHTGLAIRAGPRTHLFHQRFDE